jgi:HlyD family secretion protein
MINNSPSRRSAGFSSEGAARLGAMAMLVAVGVLGAGCARARADAVEEVYQGTAELEERTLSFEVAGRVTALNADEGDAVRAGALLATIDSALDEQARQARNLEARAAQAQANVVDKGVRPEEIAATRARLRAARSGEELVKKQLERERDLNARGVTPQARVDELETQLARSIAERETLESQLAEQQRGARPEERDAARARADAAQASVAVDDLRLAKRDLRAPADGIVLDRHVKPGEIVTPGAPVFTLADPGQLYAYVFVPEDKLAGIDVGDRANVRADGVEGALPGHVAHIARRTEFTPRYLFSEKERANLVVRVKIRVDDAKELLHAGLPVRVSIERNTPLEARTVEASPSSAPPAQLASPSSSSSPSPSARSSR